MSEFNEADLGILRRLLDDPAAVVQDATFLDEGWTNRNFRVRVAGMEYALRLCPSAADAAARRRELTVLKGPAGQLAPRLRGYLLPEGHLLTDFVEGPLLIDGTVNPDELAAFAQRVHAALGWVGRTYDGLGRIRADLQRAERQGAQPAVEAQEALAAGPPDLPADTGCHNDFNPWNVVQGADGWVVLDWETAADNHPLFDLVCMAEHLGWDADRLNAVVAYYYETLSTDPPRPKHLQAVRRWFWLGAYSWAFAERTSGNPRAELDAQIETSLAALSEF